MNVRVKQEFIDKHTGELHKIGDVLEVTLERVNEIISVGNLIELVELETEPTEQQKEPEQTNVPDETTADDGSADEKTTEQEGAAAPKRRSRKSN